MKKIIKFTLITLLCFVLVGCGCSKKNNKKKEEQAINIAETLYTDNTKLVFNNNSIYKLVFTFNKNNEITGYQHYYEYASEKDAEEKYNNDKKELKNDISIKKIERNGKFVIYTMAPSEYEGKTVSEIQESYSFLIPVYKD